MYMFYILSLFILFKRMKQKFFLEKRYEVNFLIEKALKLQNNNAIKEAKEIYQEIIAKKEEIELFEYSLALNNLVVLCYENNDLKQANLYYEELVQVREELFALDCELYGIDYIYTKVMGVEWFQKSTKELEGAKKLLASFKGVYNTTFLEQKINSLEYT